MEIKLPVGIHWQPDDVTCGPTCLHAVYGYYGDVVPLDALLLEVPQLEHGGTLAALLACHALKRGYDATIYTYNLQVFDPTWFDHPLPASLEEKLRAQMEAKDSHMLGVASRAYIDFLRLGGVMRMRDLTPGLIRQYLNRGVPILTGLSATYMYRMPREYGSKADADDIRGEPAGHFVVLCGYKRPERQVLVADPLRGNPLASHPQYLVDIDRLICAILLGILTFDANLLIIEPRATRKGTSRADSDRRQ